MEERFPRKSSTTHTNNGSKGSTSIFNIDRNLGDYIPHVRPEQTNNIIHNILETSVFSVLYNLDVNKAQGPDGILARLLKETARQIAPSLTVLFKQS